GAQCIELEEKEGREAADEHQHDRCHDRPPRGHGCVIVLAGFLVAALHGRKPGQSGRDYRDSKSGYCAVQYRFKSLPDYRGRRRRSWQTRTRERSFIAEVRGRDPLPLGLRSRAASREGWEAAAKNRLRDTVAGFTRHDRFLSHGSASDNRASQQGNQTAASRWPRPGRQALWDGTG